MKINLTPAQRQLLAWGLAAILLTALSITLGVSFPIPQPPFPAQEDTFGIAAMGVTHFTAIEADDVTATDDVVVGDALTVTGAATLDGLAVLGSTAITVTDGQTITPTGALYRLHAADAVTVTLSGACSDGQLLLLYGEDAQTVTVADSDIRTADGGAQAIGQYDLSAWLCVEGAWIALAQSANS